MWKAATLLSALPALASGHAYLTKPEMRGGANNNAGNAYCPQCLGSTSLPMATCGNAHFLDVDGPVTELVAGEMTEFVVRITAHHKGHFVFRLCDHGLSSQTGSYQAEESCLNEHVLHRARPEEVHSDCRPDDARGDCQPYDEANPGHWYLPPPGASEYRFHYWIPSGLACERCTIQWWWMSANSCTPHRDAYRCYFQEMERQGWNAGAWCGGGACSFSGACPAAQGGPSLCGEQFKNCADVRVADRGATRGPTPAPAPTPVLAPTAAPTSTPTAPAGSACVQNLNCGVNAWCADSAFVSWCPLHPAGDCPSPQCVASSPAPSPEPGLEPTTPPTMVPAMLPTAAPTAAPTTAPTLAPTAAPAPTPAPTTALTLAPTRAPTPEPTAAPTPTLAPAPEPTSGSVPVICVATPGLNRGVNDRDCKRCETGYRWWPCNEDILCQCTGGGSLVQRWSARRSKGIRGNNAEGGSRLAPDRA